MTDWDNIIGALRGIPLLDGCACAGKHELFDEDRPGETAADARRRHREAIALCQQCPALTECRAWSLTLRGPRRPSGVIGGHVHTHEPNRSRKATA